MPLQWIALGAIIVTTAGCAPATVKQTNRAQDYVGKPGRMYVITGSGMGWGKEFVDGFHQKFEEIGRQCGTTVAFEQVSGLELDDRNTVMRASQFRADTVLFIEHGGGVIMMPGGNRISIRYVTTLKDLAQRRNVWRGSFEFGRGGTVIPLSERGAVFAIDLSNSLKEDGLLRGQDCRTEELARGYRLDDNQRSVPVPAAPQPVSAPTLPPAPQAATSGAVTLQALDGLLRPPGNASGGTVPAGTGAATDSSRMALARLQQQSRDSGNARGSGAPGEQEMTYAERIRRRVRPNIVTNEQVDGNPVAVVQLNLAADGSLLSSSLIKPSGNATWDAAVLQAVERSVPYPAADNEKVPASFTITFRPR